MRFAGVFAIAIVSLGTSTRAAEPPPQYSVEDVQKAFDPATGDSPAMTPGNRRAPRTGDTRSFSLARPGNPDKAAARPALTKDLLIAFANASSELTPQAKANARVVANALTSGKLAAARFAIDGHTNAVGNRAYNLALSESRARAVADAIVGYGVDRSRLEVHGYGFDRLLKPSAPQAPENRRVEARLLK